ncbi:718e9eeb-89d1-488f-8395-3969c884c578 [Sclerotinia trifoliorum]|uniref:718e9eeb-89d1-488f-8395-3969c884c578 n=1 Tax=Sclerotinia trifoliorum TaxID=28548 RepID=A0A8H2VL25_9HELO|nr:718e9eeb-89d1-488f-8395-3969c884c578 [Sclerotinia trifoliorum]
MRKYKRNVSSKDSAMEIRGLDGAPGAQINESVKFSLGDLVPSTLHEKDPELFDISWELPISDSYKLINYAFNRYDHDADDQGWKGPNTPTPVWDDEKERTASHSPTSAATSPSEDEEFPAVNIRKRKSFHWKSSSSPSLLTFTAELGNNQANSSRKVVE